MARKPALRATGAAGAAVATGAAAAARGAEADAAGLTRASAVYERLRDDITRGLLPPGGKLRMEAMVQRYGVGATPLREALSRLSAEGLVLRSEQRGFSVAPLQWDELPVLTRNRIQLEEIALRESIARRDTAWEDELVLLVHRLGRTALSRCPSRWLRGFCDALADEAYRYRQVAAGVTFTRRDEHAEHLAIFQATIDGKADEAVRLLEAHYQRTERTVARQAKRKA
jgi:GntR family transcriptional regulator, carbon starvation induced regulator